VRQTDQSAKEYPANKPKLIMLGASKPYKGDNPSSLTRTFGQSRVLDWTSDAFKREIEVETYFVGAYRLDDITRT